MQGLISENSGYNPPVDGSEFMNREDYILIINDLFKKCDDVSLLDFIYRVLAKSV